jgi:hypothetical protein
MLKASNVAPDLWAHVARNDGKIKRFGLFEIT